MLAVTIGALCEYAELSPRDIAAHHLVPGMTVGFVLRILQHSSPSSLGLYIVQTMVSPAASLRSSLPTSSQFILLSPCAFLAQAYLLLPRLATAIGRNDLLWISPTKIARIFVWSDVITFWIQAAGGGLTAQASMADIGQKIALVGLVLQLLSFLLFCVLLVSFGWRAGRTRMSIGTQARRSLVSPLTRTKDDPALVDAWRWTFVILCTSSVGIIVRCAYRIVEYTQGYTGYIPTHEAFFYLFDSLPLALAIGVYAVWWPAVVVGDVRKSDMQGDVERIKDQHLEMMYKA